MSPCQKLPDSDSVLPAGSELEFRPADLEDFSLFKTLASWYEDPEISATLTPNRFAAEIVPPTAEQILSSYREQKKLVWFIFKDNSLVGEVTLDPDFKYLKKDLPGTAWVSIVIGERKYWGRGYGTRAMCFLEQQARELGCQRIELGVFDFNKRALHLYFKMGFKEIGTLPDFTHHDGVWHDDIRLEKWL